MFNLKEGEHAAAARSIALLSWHIDTRLPSSISVTRLLFWLQDLAAAGHASTVLGAFVCAMAVVSALSALALLLPLAKWGVLMVFRASAREEMPKHAKRALGPYLWPTAFLNMCALHSSKGSLHTDRV